MLALPPISHPQRYAGLYVYDFGSHVAVGYTEAEIRYLRASERYRNGTAYQIYRVTENGGFELRGVRDDRLDRLEALCFLRQDGSMARRDYDEIRRAAALTPLPCSAELLVVRLYDFTPPDVTALVYQTAVSHLISAWLSASDCNPGDVVRAGADEYRMLMESSGLRIDSCRLPSTVDYSDRAAEQVLAAVHEPLQR